MTDYTEPRVDEPHWMSEAATPTRAHRPVRRGMAELQQFAQTAEEIIANQQVDKSAQPLTVAALDSDAIWKNFRANKGTPLTAHRRGK